MEKSRVILSGGQKQLLKAAARSAAVDCDTLTAAVRERLVGLVGHRNRRPSNLQLQQAIEASVAQL